MELKKGMRVIGQVNNETFNATVHSVNETIANIIRDDGIHGAGEEVEGYNTWSISQNSNGDWRSDGSSGEVLKMLVNSWKERYE